VILGLVIIGALARVEVWLGNPGLNTSIWSVRGSCANGRKLSRRVQVTDGASA